MEKILTSDQICETKSNVSHRIVIEKRTQYKHGYALIDYVDNERVKTIELTSKTTDGYLKFPTQAIIKYNLPTKMCSLKRLKDLNEGDEYSIDNLSPSKPKTLSKNSNKTVKVNNTDLINEYIKDDEKLKIEKLKNVINETQRMINEIYNEILSRANSPIEIAKRKVLKAQKDYEKLLNEIK